MVKKSKAQGITTDIKKYDNNVTIEKIMKKQTSKKLKNVDNCRILSKTIKTKFLIV
jgi:hypothetical protein